MGSTIETIIQSTLSGYIHFILHYLIKLVEIVENIKAGKDMNAKDEANSRWKKLWNRIPKSPSKNKCNADKDKDELDEHDVPMDNLRIPKIEKSVSKPIYWGDLLHVTEQNSVKKIISALKAENFIQNAFSAHGELNSKNADIQHTTADKEQGKRLTTGNSVSSDKCKADESQMIKTAENLDDDIISKQRCKRILKKFNEQLREVNIQIKEENARLNEEIAKLKQRQSQIKIKKETTLANEEIFMDVMKNLFVKPKSSSRLIKHLEKRLAATQTALQWRTSQLQSKDEEIRQLKLKIKQSCFEKTTNITKDEETDGFVCISKHDIS